MRSIEDSAGTSPPESDCKKKEGIQMENKKGNYWERGQMENNVKVEGVLKEFDFSFLT